MHHFNFLSRSSLVASIAIILLLTSFVGALAGPDVANFEDATDPISVNEDLDVGPSSQSAMYVPHLIRTKAATFDPLSQDPDIPSELAIDRPEGYAILQTFGPIEEWVSDRVEEVGGSLVGYLPDYALVVKGDDEVFSSLEGEDFTRWLGPYHPAYKISEELMGSWEINGEVDLFLKIFDPAWNYRDGRTFEMTLPILASTIVEIQGMGGKIMWEQLDTHLIPLTIDAQMIPSIARLPDVEWVQSYSPPINYMNNVQVFTGADGLHTIGVNGSGIIGEVKDAGFDQTHPDFIGPLIGTDGSPGVHPHGTCTFGIVFGTGAGNPNAEGMIPSGQGIMCSWSVGRSVSINNLVNNWGGLFQTNSWGSGVMDGGYTSLSVANDQAMVNQDVLILYSAGNSNSGVGAQTISQDSASKNVMCVGAVYHYNNVNLLDDQWTSGSAGGTPSQGPAKDNRIKPDICGVFDATLAPDGVGSGGYVNGNYFQNFGGTSGACPIVAGGTGLVQEMFSENFFGNNPWGVYANPSTVKALVIANAYQYQLNKATRYQQGWGLIDVGQIQDVGYNHTIFDENNSASTGSTFAVGVLPTDIHPLKVSLVWTDTPGSPGASTALVNDLDLEVKDPNGNTYRGNVGLRNALYSTTGGSADRLNNVENVFIQNPSQGNWLVTVKGFNVVGSQPYSLVVSGATSGASAFFFNQANFDTVDAASLTLWDRNITGQGTQDVTVASTSDPVPHILTLQENPANSGFFTGSIQLVQENPGAFDLLVADEDILIGNYTEDWPPGFRIASSIIDASYPKNVTVEPDPRGNALNISWFPTTRSTMLGYNLYRNTTTPGEFEIRQVLSIRTMFHDYGLADGVEYSYYLTTRDLNFESGNSSIESGTPQDITPPSVVIFDPKEGDTINGIVPIDYETHNDTRSITFQYYFDTDADGFDNDGGVWIGFDTISSINGSHEWTSNEDIQGKAEIMIRANATDEVPLDGPNSGSIIHLHIDNSPPSEVTVAPLPEVTRSPTQEVAVTVFDAEGGLEAGGMVEIRKNALLVASGKTYSDGTRLLNVPLTEGFNTFTVNAFDALGNGPGPEVSVQVVLDTISPTADAGTNNMTGVAGVPMLFDASKSSDTITASSQYNRIENYTWTFLMRGTEVEFYGGVVNYSVPTYGDFDVTLTVTDRAGNNDQDMFGLRVKDTEPPHADAGGNRSVDENEIIYFSAEGSSDNDGELFTSGSFAWRFNDGTYDVSLFGLNVSYIFYTPGVYPVELNVTDRAGNYDGDEIFVTVIDVERPNANAGSDQVVYQFEEVSLDGSASTDNDPTFPSSGNFTWTFYDDSREVVLYGIKASYIFEIPGQYPVTLDVKDAAMNKAISSQILITVEVDTSPPRVLSRYPMRNQVNTPYDTNITVEFSKPMDLSGLINGISLTLVSATELVVVEGVTDFDRSTNTYNFDPDTFLLSGRSYIVEFTEQVEDLAGNRLEDPEYESWQFTTEVAGVPEILDHIPKDDETDVLLDVQIKVFFNRQMKLSSFTDQSIQVKDQDGALVLCNYDTTGEMLTITPMARLGTETTYTVSINERVTDLYENHLLSEVSWSFTTGTQVSSQGDGFRFEDPDGDEYFGVEAGSSICLIFVIVFIVIIVGIIGMVVVSRGNKKARIKAAEKKFVEEQGGPAYDDYRREDVSGWSVSSEAYTELSSLSSRRAPRRDVLGDTSGHLPKRRAAYDYDDDGIEDEYWDDLMQWEDSEFEEVDDREYEDIPEEDLMEFEIEEDDDVDGPPVLEEDGIVEEGDEFSEWLEDE